MTTTAILISEDGLQHRLVDTLSIGREDDNDIVLKNDRVSRRHAQLSIRGDEVLLEDLNSSNGTRLNGETISASVSLQDGDSVRIGPFSFSVSIGQAGTQNGGATVFGEATTPNAGGDTQADAGHSDAEAAEPETPLPGSWVESEDLESTQFFRSPLQPGADGITTVQRHGDLPQLLLLDASGAVEAVIELEPGRGGGEDVWEIGRQQECDVAIEDPTVSTRHAQLIHKGQRWRLVNLVSSNGIFVNGEKRLAVYLSDGDLIQLGGSRLVFFGDASAAAPGADAKSETGTSAASLAPGTQAGGAGATAAGARRWLALGGALLLLALLLYLVK